MIQINTNNLPLGGLSPNEVHQLIYTSWGDKDCPLKFNKELKLSDIKHSTFFTNTTIFLKTLIEMEKEPTATAKGNLNRKIVIILFDKFVIDKDYKKTTLEYNKVLNEEDVFPLHIIRIVCEEAGLIHRIKNKFLVFKKQQNLLSENKAGELYNLLFNSYFKKFNIGYMDRFPDLDCIQHTIAYSLFRLGEIADSWVDMEDLFDDIFLPEVKLEIVESIVGYMFVKGILKSRIINPLDVFGLVECIYSEERYYSDIKKVRKTKLFDRFLCVRW